MFLHIAGAALAAGHLGAQTRRPNLIYILADDLGWHELGCYGNTFNETPTLDRLAAEGVRFTQAYAAAPVCSPYRAALMTGQWPARVGITDYLRPDSAAHLAREQVTIAEALGGAGYATGIVGKWHLSGYAAEGAEWVGPADQGFSEVMVPATRGIGGGSYFHPYHWNPDLQPRLGEHEQLIERMNLEALEFIERHREEPFFLYLSHMAVHTRLNGQPDLVAKYEAKPEAGKGPQARANNPHLAAQLEVIGTGVGQILAKLRQLGLDRDTVVIFTSDNGGEDRVTDNGPLRAGKSTLYEGGIREPLIVWAPGRVLAGLVTDTVTSNVDIHPTLCELAGVRPPAEQHLDGVSIVPALRGPNVDLGRDTLYWHYPLEQPHFLGGRSAGAIREGDWKLIEDFTTGEVELYNLADDLGEEHNLAPEQPDRAKALLSALRLWQAEVGAKIVKHRGEATAVIMTLAGQRRRLLNVGVDDEDGALTFNGRSWLDLPRQDAPEVANKRIAIAATVSPTAPNGVILAHGGNRWGYALHLVDGRPTFTVALDYERTSIAAPERLAPTAKVEARWLAGGEMRLLVDNVQVARGTSGRLLPTNPGDSLQIGGDTIQPVGEYQVENGFTGVMRSVGLTVE